MVAIGPVTLGNTAASWMFGFLIPLIIIYLIRPRPVTIEIPSLMFFMENKSDPRQKSFFRRLSKDWLLLIQMLIIALLALMALNPYMIYEHDVAAENTVIVLDVSASSQVKENKGTRFEIGIEAAKQALSIKNTIILAKNSPKIILESGDRDQAEDAFKGLIPYDTPTALGDSIILAGETLGGKEGRVVVISDFINTIGISPNRARAVVEGKGIVVDFITTAGEKQRDNVGITNLQIDDETTTIFVKNYNDKVETVKARVGDFSKTLNINAKSTETFTIETPEKVARIEINSDDDFDADNIAFTSAPETNTIKILLVSNNASIYLKNALESTEGVKVTIAEPPIVPKERYDIYVLGNIDPSQILPGTLEGIKDNVKKGASIVITANPTTNQIDFKELNPIGFDELLQRGYVQIDQLNTFTKDIEFGVVDQLWNTIKQPTTVQIASVEGTPIIAFKQMESGKSLYFGIMEEASEFKMSPAYPIFWSNVIKFMIETESISNLNLRTGDTILLSEVAKIQTPTRTVKQNALLLEEAGVYELEDRKLAVNLLNEKESNINPIKTKDTGTATDVELQEVTEERQFDFEIPILIIAMIIMLLELLYVKMRGDF